MSKKITELTDRELAEGQYKYIKQIESNTSSHKNLGAYLEYCFQFLGGVLIAIQLNS